jgi:hypothetical protein
LARGSLDHSATMTISTQTFYRGPSCGSVIACILFMVDEWIEAKTKITHSDVMWVGGPTRSPSISVLLRDLA